MKLNGAFLSAFAMLFLVASLALAEPLPTPTPCPESVPRSSLPEPPVEIFPFSIPYYVLKGATYPVHELGHWVEKNKYLRWTLGFVTSKNRDFSIYPILTVGDGKQLGGGLGITHLNLFRRDYRLKTQFVIYQDLDQRAVFSLSNDQAFRALGRDFSFEFLSSWYKSGDEDFFGVGPDTQKSNKAEYGLRRFVVGARFGFELIPKLSLSPRIFFDTALGNAGNSDLPDSVVSVFPPSDLPGFGRNISYLDFGFRLAHDDRDASISPSHGGLRELVFHRYMGLGQKGFDYLEWDLDVEQYFRLWRPRLILWLHNAWTFQSATGGSEIPFYRMATLDVDSPLRGFDSGRFHDKGSVVFNAEFRFPLWDNVDGTAFFDTGRVFPGITGFSFRDFRFSGGGGIRITVSQLYLFRLEAATGGEGLNLIFRAQQNL